MSKRKAKGLIKEAEGLIATMQYNFLITMEPDITNLDAYFAAYFKAGYEYAMKEMKENNMPDMAVIE